MSDPLTLFERLRCPVTQQRLSTADPELIARLNEAIQAGTLTQSNGTPIREPLQGGLVREDGTLLYPLRRTLPVMLLAEAVPLDGL
ncbi:MAG: hypothetical protein AAFS10_15700 [Myxococcota bacterium]